MLCICAVYVNSGVGTAVFCALARIGFAGAFVGAFVGAGFAARSLREPADELPGVWLAGVRTRLAGRAPCAAGVAGAGVLLLAAVSQVRRHRRLSGHLQPALSMARRHRPALP